MLKKLLPQIERRDALAALVSGALVFILGLLFGLPLSTNAYIAILAAGAVFAAAVVFRKIHHGIRSSEDAYRQVEELFSLFHTLNFRAPLPRLRGWALSPDAANILVDLVLREKPKRVLDLGSGASTVLIGYALEKNGEGTVLAIDHESDYAERSRKLIKVHGLENKASVKVAPLSDVQIPAGKWRWYDTAFIRDVGKIDLVFVDGPPDRSHFLARYPALPLLIEHLSPHAIIVIDDAYSSGEREMVKRWLSEYPEFHAEHLSTEKGTCVLRRR